MTKPVALVTGASSGIGLELSKQLAAGGHDLFLVARSMEQLGQVARDLQNRNKVRVAIQSLDLSQPGTSENLWRRLTDGGVAVDILVNNAGVGLHGPFSDQSLDAIGQLIAVNVLALTTLTRLALPEMRARRHGRILNVASVVAFQPGGPQQAVYYASKSFVLSFSKGLARELRGSGVSVTALCPGPTRTAFETRSGAEATGLYKWLPAMSAAAVAQAGYRGMMRGSAVVIPGLIAKLVAFAGELPPRRVALEVNRLLLKSTSKAA